jgi:hypothetical protein
VSSSTFFKAASTLLVACALALPGCALEPAAAPPEAPQQALEVPAEALNPDVRPETIQTTICVPGYTLSVRPSTTYMRGVEHKLLRERGLPPEAASQYELDHIVPLALGGHPRNLKNLMLQSWEGDDGAKKKDQLERRLQRLVCAGSVGLREAQAAIYFDWKAALEKYSR